MRGAGEYVLYWMIAARRLDHNFALDGSLEYCRELDKPLLILEAPETKGWTGVFNVFHTVPQGEVLPYY